jgi:tRNA pseudouridine38-40 synthase
VGTLIELGKGKMNIERFKKAIEGKERTKGGPSAPAQGLFLREVKY